MRASAWQISTFLFATLKKIPLQKPFLWQPSKPRKPIIRPKNCFWLHRAKRKQTSSQKRRFVQALTGTGTLGPNGLRLKAPPKPRWRNPAAPPKPGAGRRGGGSARLPVRRLRDPRGPPATHPGHSSPAPSRAEPCGAGGAPGRAAPPPAGRGRGPRGRGRPVPAWRPERPPVGCGARNGGRRPEGRRGAGRAGRARLARPSLRRAGAAVRPRRVPAGTPGPKMSVLPRGEASGGALQAAILGSARPSARPTAWGTSASGTSLKHKWLCKEI